MASTDGLDLIAIGRSSIDLYGEQTGGRLEDMLSFAKYIGGSPTNTAVGGSRLGLRTGLLTRVGNDHCGRFIREQLAAGVEQLLVLPRVVVLKQTIDREGGQREEPDWWDPAAWCTALDAMIAVPIEGRAVWIRPWLYVLTSPVGHAVLVEQPGELLAVPTRGEASVAGDVGEDEAAAALADRIAGAGTP